jgi:hypothetical protein
VKAKEMLQGRDMFRQVDLVDSLALKRKEPEATIWIVAVFSREVVRMRGCTYDPSTGVTYDEPLHLLRSPLSDCSDVHKKRGTFVLGVHIDGVDVALEIGRPFRVVNELHRVIVDDKSALAAGRKGWWK